jgi:GTP cyclohydrolase I
MAEWDMMTKGLNGRLEAVGKLLASVPESEREGLKETPMRFLTAFDFFMSGYSTKPQDILKTFEDGAENIDEMVFQGKIPFYSMCEHHLAPFFGYAHIAYIPKGRIVGLSKLSRLVEIFARRLQVQERLCDQICGALDIGLAPVGAAVTLQARHMCMESRGIQKTGSITITTSLRGAIKAEASARAEYMALVQTMMQGVTSL